MIKRDKNNETQKFWDKQAAKYDYRERQFEPVFQQVLLKTKELFNKNDLVLDYGCATGKKTLKLAPSVKHICGLDISSGMINEAVKRKKELRNNNANFIQGSIFDDNLKGESFDKIVAYGIIHLLHDIEPVFNRRNLYSYLWGILKNNKCQLYQMGGTADHIHMLTSIHSTVCLANLIRDMKTGR
jgi:ubiquinone/menaquinone biosynthesis C-methylase UbiE